MSRYSLKKASLHSAERINYLIYLRPITVHGDVGVVCFSDNLRLYCSCFMTRSLKGNVEKGQRSLVTFNILNGEHALQVYEAEVLHNISIVCILGNSCMYLVTFHKKNVLNFTESRFFFEKQKGKKFLKFFFY